MPCEFIELGQGKDKVTAIICTRGRKKWCACGKQATRLCDYPNPTKRKRDKTCDIGMCPGCTTNVGPDRDLCAAHVRTVRAAGWPGEIMADPNPHARSGRNRAGQARPRASGRHRRCLHRVRDLSVSRLALTAAERR